MRNERLAGDCLRRAGSRLLTIEVLMRERSWADVVSESQEVVGIVLEALLRAARIEVPQIHDMSPILEENRDRLPAEVNRVRGELTSASRALRRDRELAIYGSEDLTPSEFYREEDAECALTMSRRVYEVVHAALP
jgi:HEPN domain-containing protein